MVELLWRWVMKINARAVFLSALLVLCIALVMLLRQGSRQDSALEMSGHHVKRVPAVGSAARYDRERVPSDQIQDPFTSAFLVAWLDLEASRKREREAARMEQRDEEEVRPEPPKPKPASTPKKTRKPQWVGVMYQGMVSRTDGSCVALVGEVEGGALHTLKVGEALLGWRVVSILAERVVLAVGQDSELPLRVGVVSRIPRNGS